MNTYRTSEIARIIGIHPNTVRLYEELKLIPAPLREPNGYRIFTDVHIEHFKLARIALQIEVLQNGLRKKAIEIIKVSASGDFGKALDLTESYLQQIRREQLNAEDAVQSVTQLLSHKQTSSLFLKRKETAEYLQISIDTLRNWEMNGLISVKRKENGYRVYVDEDIRRLKIIRSLRCANYSLSSILRMLNTLSNKPDVDIKHVIDTPKGDEVIVSVCDKLLTSLRNAESNAKTMRCQLESMKKLFI